MQTDFSDALNTVFTPSWAAILGRETEKSEPILIPQAAGRRVLITGAGGFIGSEMVRVLAASGAQQIILLDVAEQPLFTIDTEMTARGYGGRCVPILGSVCDGALLTAILDDHRPAIILHAAALKHVPLMERNPFAAVETNSLGTWRLAQTALEHGVEKTILVSTDKAVAPHSIMGASKRIAELAILAHPAFATAVRLVNVIGSPGSVGPLFAEQIARGGPVTVTHPAVRRFFLTLHDVVALLAQALLVAPARGLLVPDTGDSVLIADIAQRMIAASGSDIPIVFTELRPGDKLEESAISPRERLAGYAAPGLRRVLSPSSADLETHMAGVESAIAARDLPLLLRLVQTLVPDYEPGARLRAVGSEFATASAP
ncbi:MAG: polysaccharide biosynthesis protein [Acidobacteriaceae bacterium]